MSLLPSQGGPSVGDRLSSATLQTVVAEPSVEVVRQRRFGTWLRTQGLAIEMTAAVVAGLLAAFVEHADVFTALGLVAAWSISTYHRGNAVTSPLSRQLRDVIRAAVVPIAVAAGAFTLLGASQQVIPQAMGVALASSGVAAACRMMRWRVQSPVRLVVVGDRIAVAQATSRWATTRRVKVVGGVVVEPDIDPRDVPRDILGAPTATGLDATRSMANRLEADLVVVAPGPGFTAVDFRRLCWSLEDTDVKIGVLGVLDTVAPHRITPGGLGTATLMGVRAPRPSAWVRLVKSGADRLAGLALLAVVAPVLLGLMLAVKIDSRGPAFFKQTRVGRHGKHFTVFKMRTMVKDADTIKARLAQDNEYDGVLFKMKEDPRVTRVGKLLRRSSLDELPQLLNVVRGEMSLVGPRPFLPDETDKMDGDTLRRLAVKPGITGLWQVSGRSDLGWDEASLLDTYYADNWSLAGDVAIGLRTVSAVVGAKGAY